MGLMIDAEGLHLVEKKADAVKRAPVPQNVSELRSFLGMIMVTISTRFSNHTSTITCAPREYTRWSISPREIFSSPD